MAPQRPTFDPVSILAALERNRVSYVMIGGLAQVLRGADITTTGLDMCPSFAKDNLDRLDRAVRELLPATAADRALPVSGELQAGAPAIVLETTAGELKIIGSPAGVPNGYVELRRAATTEDLGQGIRPLVASTADLAAMAVARGHEQDLERVAQLRRIVELEARPAEVKPPPAPARRAARGLGRGGPRLTP